jgi:hypothetical protein
MKRAIGCGAVILLLMVFGIVYVFVGKPWQQSPNTADAVAKIELNEAYSKGLVEFHAHGSGSITSFEINLSSKSKKALNVLVLPGSIFTCSTPFVQSMIVRAEETISLQPKETIDSYVIKAACMNMDLSVPMRGHELTLSTSAANEDLIKLVQLTAFQNQGFRLQQFAVWTITNNPTNVDEYKGISSGYYPFGTGPGKEDIDTIRVLFESGGIDTDKYYALSGNGN